MFLELHIMWFSIQDLLDKLSKLWLYFIVLLIAQEAHATVIIDPTCGANMNVQAALTEAIAMARNAATRQTALRDVTLNQADWRVILKTFDAYFGTLGLRQQIQNPYVTPNAVHVSEILTSKSSSNNSLYS